MEKELKYKGHTITVKFPSGMFEYYSDKQGRFLKFDTLKAAKESITDESKKGKSVNESVKKITLSELKGIVRKLVMEQKSEYNEISDELFSNALKSANDKGMKKQRDRIFDLGMRKLKGYRFPDNENELVDNIEFDGRQLNITIKNEELETYSTIYYNADHDLYMLDQYLRGSNIRRSVANFLSKIAKKLNPDTQYTTPHAFKLADKYGN